MDVLVWHLYCLFLSEIGLTHITIPEANSILIYKIETVLQILFSLIIWFNVLFSQSFCHFSKRDTGWIGYPFANVNVSVHVCFGYLIEDQLRVGSESALCFHITAAKSRFNYLGYLWAYLRLRKRRWSE